MDYCIVWIILLLLEEFNKDEVKKEYVAVSYTMLDVPDPSINDWIKKERRSDFIDPYTFSLSTYFTHFSKNDKTKVRLLFPNEANDQEKNRGLYTSEITLLKKDREFVATHISLQRGFRHQIRAHLAFLNLPIVGDMVYGNDDTTPYLCLFATTISFKHPKDQRMMKIRSHVPSWMNIGFLKKKIKD